MDTQQMTAAVRNGILQAIGVVLVCALIVAVGKVWWDSTQEREQARRIQERGPDAPAPKLER